MATAKKNTQKITPTIAKILAERIVEAVKNSVESDSARVKRINAEVDKYPEVAEGMKLMKKLEELNAKISKKTAKDINNSYADYKYFAITSRDKGWISTYWLKKLYNVPDVEVIKNEILMESFFSDGVSPDTIVAQYVKKYTKK